MRTADDVLSLRVDPRLDGASCAHLWPSWDPQEEDEARVDFHDRVAAAARVCARCPVLDACREVADELPYAQRRGIWAGHYYRGGTLIPPAPRTRRSEP